jgi:hypothetical protein
VRHEVAQYTVKHPFRKRLHRAGAQKKINTALKVDIKWKNKFWTTNNIK